MMNQGNRKDHHHPVNQHHPPTFPSFVAAQEDQILVHLSPPQGLLQPFPPILSNYSRSTQYSKFIALVKDTNYVLICRISKMTSTHTTRHFQYDEVNYLSYMQVFWCQNYEITQLIAIDYRLKPGPILSPLYIIVVMLQLPVRWRVHVQMQAELTM